MESRLVSEKTQKSRSARSDGANASLTPRLLSWAVQYIRHIDTECHNNILDKNESMLGSPNIDHSFSAPRVAVIDRGE